jgi:hypothetical protein
MMKSGNTLTHRAHRRAFKNVRHFRVSPMEKIKDRNKR